MIYKNTVEAVFISRPNRFEALVDIDGRKETVHVKNTGRCRELLIPGRAVTLAPSENPGRKNLYDLISVKKPGPGWINIDSQLPNALVREWLLDFKNGYFAPDLIKQEYVYGNSRIDFYLEEEGVKTLIEVKGCTLETEGKGYFPDAPTVRGAKHLNELMKAHTEGFRSYIAYVITVPGVTEVFPNENTDPVFSETYKKAIVSGVSCLMIPCKVGPFSVEVEREKVSCISNIRS